MNAQNQKDQSYYTMIAEHQELSARVLRLHSILNQHHCVQHMPTEACILINEMKNIVMTGNAQPDGIESFDLNFDELPFIDPENRPDDAVHSFKVCDVVMVPDLFARYKLKVSSKQRFTIERLIDEDQLYVCCIPDEKLPFTNNETCFTAHYSHFAKVEVST